MSSPQENTKIEQLTDAIESLCVSIAQGMVIGERIHPNLNTTPELVALQRTDARAEVATALRDFLKPSLRVVNQIEERIGDIAVTKTRTVERTYDRDAPPPTKTRPGHKDICTDDRCHCGPQ